MRNIKLILSYDGADFCGWQTQLGVRTVQTTVEEAIRRLTGAEEVHANASGRTDSGVHAVGQVVNFFTESKLAPGVIMRGLNAQLPADVVVSTAEDVAPDFDANRSAVRKLYRYVINDGPIAQVFLRKYCLQTRYHLDSQAMQQAAECLRGQHDFRSFESNWPNRQTSVRTITHLAMNRFADWIWLDVEADGFLYNMVRSIAGTLINVGRGFWPESEVRRILTAQDRGQAGPTAPPQGLFLMRVTYEQK
jgi:tRNA pseudouridine38-40 synthase